MKYIRLTRGVADKGRLLNEPEVLNNVNESQDWYTSLFTYNDAQYNDFLKAGSVKGVKNVTTTKLWWDFDSKSDVSLAQKDALTLISRLPFVQKDIEIYYSGNKGFNVLVTTDKEMTPSQVYDICINRYGQDLKTLDSSMYDAPQILRVPGTKHQVSGLFKIPLTYSQLQNQSVAEIRSIAKSLDNIKEEFNWSTVSIPDEFLIEEPKINITTTSEELDFTNKPSQWRNCKWSLLQGHFDEGQRHSALLVIAATCRGLGYDKDTTYYMCKSALKKQSSLKGQEEFPKEELYNNIIEQSVFTDGWEGGQYSCKKSGWLQTYCQSLGEHSCTEKEEDVSVVRIESVGEEFFNYAENFDKNIIKTGLRELDDQWLLSTGSLNGVLGQPGGGKTTVALNILENASMSLIDANFASLDMSKPLLYSKLVQKETGMGFKNVLKLFRDNPTQAREYHEIVKEKYKYVNFNFKSGVTVADIRKSIEEQQQTTGRKVKLLVVDYLERIAGPHSDATANTGFIANQLTDLANDMQVCVVLLLQTQKHSTPDISDPLLSLKNVKGSSIIEQGCSTILTLWREGYNPRTVQHDKYISFAIVKNRMGGLWSGDFSWHGITGNIEELSEEERDSLANFRKNKIEERLKALKQNDDWS